MYTIEAGSKQTFVDLRPFDMVVRPNVDIPFIRIFGVENTANSVNVVGPV
jgi:hypothetical protein